MAHRSDDGSMAPGPATNFSSTNYEASGNAPLNPLLEPQLHAMAGTPEISDAYNSLTAQVNAQKAALDRITQSQSALDQQRAQGFVSIIPSSLPLFLMPILFSQSTDRAAVESRLQRMEQQVI